MSLLRQAGVRPAVKGNRGIKVVRSRVIPCAAQPLYGFWRRVENLPRIIPHLRSVTELSPTESLWVAERPGCKTIQWRATIFNDHPGELIAWRTEGDSGFNHAGSVRFEPRSGGQETEVTISMEYDPPGGRIGAMIARLSGEDPAEELDHALERLSEVFEKLPTAS